MDCDRSTDVLPTDSGRKIAIKTGKAGGTSARQGYAKFTTDIPWKAWPSEEPLRGLRKFGERRLAVRLSAAGKERGNHCPVDDGS